MWINKEDNFMSSVKIILGRAVGVDPSQAITMEGN